MLRSDITIRRCTSLTVDTLQRRCLLVGRATAPTQEGIGAIRDSIAVSEPRGDGGAGHGQRIGFVTDPDVSAIVIDPEAEAASTLDVYKRLRLSCMPGLTLFISNSLTSLQLTLVGRNLLTRMVLTPINTAVSKCVGVWSPLMSCCLPPAQCSLWSQLAGSIDDKKLGNDQMRQCRLWSPGSPSDPGGPSTKTCDSRRTLSGPTGFIAAQLSVGAGMACCRTINAGSAPTVVGRPGRAGMSPIASPMRRIQPSWPDRGFGATAFLPDAENPFPRRFRRPPSALSVVRCRSRSSAPAGLGSRRRGIPGLRQLPPTPGRVRHTAGGTCDSWVSSRQGLFVSGFVHG